MVPPTAAKPRRVLTVVTLATITIFGGLIALITWELRQQLRAEVLRREAESIHAVALMQLARAEEQLAGFAAEFAIDDLFAAVLESSKLRGVLAVQLFDAAGVLRKASTIAPDDAESSRWWPSGLRTPEARFIADGTLDLFAPVEAIRRGADERLPLLEIAVPLQRTPESPTAAATARYWIDGAGVAGEFKRMDRRLITQGTIAFVAGSILVALVLVWAFTRLAAANRRLVEQSADLARANQELDFAAKTGALGAISAHLIHGLNNPLAGIEGFVAETATAAPDALRGEAWRSAMETTKRLRALVTEVTTVLRDEADGAANYPVPVAEILDAARARALPAAQQAGIQLSVDGNTDAVVSARVANLTGLVLANLVANAIEATPRGGNVALETRAAGGTVTFSVRDSGPGIPAAVQAGLFRPVRSAKRGGGGVGLAISHRLAKHAAGNLELVRSDAGGTEFRLAVPALISAVNPTSTC